MWLVLLSFLIFYISWWYGFLNVFLSLLKAEFQCPFRTCLLLCSSANNMLGSYYFSVFNLADHNVLCYITLDEWGAFSNCTDMNKGSKCNCSSWFCHVVVSNYNVMAHAQTQSLSFCWRQYSTCRLEFTEIADWLGSLESPHWLKIKSHHYFHSKVSPTLFHNLQ